MTDDEYHKGIFGTPEKPTPTPEWVKLIPAGSIPVFCFAPETDDADLDRYGMQLRAFFGDRKVLVIRGEVDIYAVADREDK